MKVLREELDLLTRFHYENKSNFECLVEDDVPDVNLDGSRSTCEGSLIHYDEHKYEKDDKETVDSMAFIGHSKHRYQRGKS